MKVEWLFSLLFVTLLTLVSASPLSPSDETEYEYSGSDEEDEERDVGEPRLVSSLMYDTRDAPSGA